MNVFRVVYLYRVTSSEEMNERNELKDLKNLYHEGIFVRFPPFEI